MVDVFCQLVTFVHDNRAWRQYFVGAPPVGHSLAPVCDSWRFSSYSFNLYAKTFRELERSWTGDEAINGAILRSLGPSTCADLVKVSPCHAMQTHGNISLGSIGIVSRTAHLL